jgi:hypothetical protein
MIRALKSGEYRDAHLELEEKLRKSGPIAETAVQIVVEDHSQFFVLTGDDYRHRLNGMTMDEWVADRRNKSAPHDYLDFEPVTEEQIGFEIIEDACLRPQPKTVGTLFKRLGEPRAKDILAQWGTDWVRMIPGQRPGYVDDQNASAEAQAKLATNPWSKDFRGDAEAERLRIIKTSTKMAAGMAKAAGVRIDGGPLLR